MNRRWFGAALAALLVAGGVAEARMHHPYRGHRIVPANAAPLDGFTAPAAAYSFRKLRTAYAGPAVNIRRVSDSAVLDVGFVGNNFDTAAATTFCAATTCAIVTWYDQSGNARHLTNAGPAQQPAFVFNCQGSLPCSRMTLSTQSLASAASITPATGAASLSVAALRTGTGSCTLIRENGNVQRLITTSAVANSWTLNPATGIAATAADGAWHAGIGVINGASSVLSIDGTETAGTVTGTTAAGTPAIIGAATTTCDQGEIVIWDAYVLTPAERTALTNNQRNYWMPAPLDSFTQPSGAYSFRKLKSTYAGPAIRIRRASDNLELDINFLGCTSFTGCPLDVAAATAHCASTTCTVVTMYDQSGNARDITNATQASQPPLVFNCLGGLPCSSNNAASTGLITTANVTPTTGAASFAAVARRSVGTGQCSIIRQNGPAGNRISARGGANGFQLIGGTSGSVQSSVPEGIWYSLIGVLNGASSSHSTNGGTSFATATGSVTAGSQGALGVISTQCDGAEAIVWDNYVLTTAEIAVLSANQRSFWGVLMRWLAAILATLLLALPAYADMYQDASNAKLPWVLHTTNDPALNNGIYLITGFTGSLDNSAQARYWGLQVQYGAETCEDQFFNLFRKIRGFAYGIGSCATSPANPAVAVGQFIPGLFSIAAYDSNGIPLVAQSSIRANNIVTWGLNSLKWDTYIRGESTVTGASVSGTTLTTDLYRGSFAPGDTINGGTGFVLPGTYIVAQLSGTPGGAGTYKLNYAQSWTGQRIMARPYFYGGLVQDEYDNYCEMNDTRCRNIISGFFPNGEQAATQGATLTGTITAGDVLNVTITEPGLLTGSPKTISATMAAGDTTTAAATKLVAAAHLDADLQAAGYKFRAVDNIVKIYYVVNNGPLAVRNPSFGQSVTGAATETITLGLLLAGNNERFGLGVNNRAFIGGVPGKWQNAFQSSDGSANFALMVGTADQADAMGRRSQAIKFNYTDNSNVNFVERIATLHASPASAGATGVDMVIGNNSLQNTNLRILDGGIWMSGNLVTETPIGNTHIMRTTVNNGNDTELWFQKARGATAGPTVITAGDNLGTIRFQGYDGTGYTDGAFITSSGAGPISAGAVGGTLSIFTNNTRRILITDTMTTFGPPASASAIKPSAFGRLQARAADDLSFAFIQGKHQTDTNYVAGLPTMTGYLTLYDAAGVAYKVPACTAC